MLAGELSLRRLSELTTSENEAAELRRKFLEDVTGADLSPLAAPQLNFDELVGRNIENPVGAASIPLGVVGPLKVEGDYARGVFFPVLATSEGALVASVNRGVAAIHKSGGARAAVLNDEMTRAPLIKTSGLGESLRIARWVEDNLTLLQEEVSEVTRHGRLIGVRAFPHGRNLFLRLRFSTGDAMGMNMVTIASERIVRRIMEEFPGVIEVALSGNLCTDKKPAAVNWVSGRGKTVAAEAVIGRRIVSSVLKTSPEEIFEVYWRKNLLGSAAAGTLGGFNAHFANIVAAMFAAYGQDLAQVVESSMGISVFELTERGDLYSSVILPSLEVGTVGGGTRLPHARAALSALGCLGGGRPPGSNAKKFAEIVAATVLAGELSLLASLAEGSLARSHRMLGRGGQL